MQNIAIATVYRMDVFELELQTHCELGKGFRYNSVNQIWLPIIRNKEPFGGDNV